jgi:DNA-binding transcriptional ArsR family regulator
MTKIVLDAESFKALASDTRLQILKALDARPLTVSELSRLLDLNKATVFEHLKQLTVADLAKREDDPARKWVYYKLTWKGRNVLHPENAQIFIMLGLGALGFGGAVLQTARILRLYLEGSSSQTSESASDVDTFASEDTSQRQQAPAAAGSTAGTSTASGGSQADKAGAQTTAAQTEAAQAPADDAAAGGGDDYWDSLRSTDFLIVFFILSFLVLIALLVRSLYVQQRRERRQVLALIDRLPADVNAAEQRGV